MRRTGLSQAQAKSCQTPEKHLKTDRPAKTLSVSLHLHTLPSRNAESRTQTLDQAKGSLLQEKEEEEGEAVDCGRRCEEVTVRGRGDGGRGLPQCYKHQTWQQEEQWSSEPNKTSPNLNQILSHDNSQLYGAALDTLCIHTAKINTGLRECDSQKQQSPETQINKALRLVKQVLLLAAGRTLYVCMCVRTGVKRLLDTFPQWEKMLAESVHIFVWNIYTSHHSRGKAHVPPGLHVLSAKIIFPVCLSAPLYLCICVWEREYVCECILSDLWRRLRPGQKGQKWRKTVRHYVPPRVFCLCYLRCFLDDKL